MVKMSQRRRYDERQHDQPGPVSAHDSMPRSVESRWVRDPWRERSRGGPGGGQGEAGVAEPGEVAPLRAEPVSGCDGGSGCGAGVVRRACSTASIRRSARNGL